MWFTFFCGVLLAFLILYLPGFIQLFIAKSKAAFALVCAPIVSMFELCIVGATFGLLGVSISGFNLVAVLGAVTMITATSCFFISKKHEVKYLDLLSSSDILWKNILLYVCLSVVIVGYFFIRTLDGPESFVQEFDNAFHLNLIHAFMESDRFSVLQATTFPSLPIQARDDIAYYPAAWHVVAAVCGDIMSVSAEMAENFTNVVFLSAVFPISICAFVSMIFKNNKAVIPFCGLFVLAFAAFPWGFLVAGPLYSNLAAFSLLPGVMFSFIKLVNSIKEGKLNIRLIYWLSLVLVGIILLAMTQPNAVFTAIVILTPFCMVQIFNHWNENARKTKGYIFAFVFCGFVCLIWVLCRHLGMFQDVVNYSWQPYATFSQAIFDYLDLGYRNATAQLLLAGLVLFGILHIMYKKQRRWLVASYLFFFIAFLSAAATTTGFHGSLFSGFWYNDVDRIAASAVLVMIPFAGEGLYALVTLMSSVVKSAWGDGSGTVLSILLSVLCVGLIFAPNHILAGKGDVITSIGSREARLAELATTEVCLTKEEEDFVSEVISLIGEDAKVVNYSFDGSVFTYATNDLNILTRHYFSSNSGDMSIIQKNLSDLSISSEVQEAVNSVGAEYVLLLDVGDESDNSIYSAFLDENDWKGITSITEDTPGFTLILTEGDMRLYQIDSTYY